jgi:hypothetical protein
MNKSFETLLLAVFGLINFMPASAVILEMSQPQGGERPNFIVKPSVQNKQSGSIRLGDEDLKKLSDIDKKRLELKANEQKALEFILPGVDQEEELEREKFFSQTEQDQLLELWRATLARNRTVQFVIKSLSADPKKLEDNNLVMQALSKALFVPFYTVSAITNNALVSGGSAVGARVIGDVVDTNMNKHSVDKQVSRTDLIVLFLLVDEVAQRLRDAYYDYKGSRIQKQLLLGEIESARIDAGEALVSGTNELIFFTRMALRDLERRLRIAELDYGSSRRTLVELAGWQALETVDLMIDQEIDLLRS